MFLIFQLFTGGPLLVGSVAAGCCQSRFAVRAWTVAAMLMPMLFFGTLGIAALVYGEYNSAGGCAVILLLCYAASRVIRFVVFHIKRALTDPQDAGDAAGIGDGIEHDCGDGGGDGGDADGGD